VDSSFTRSTLSKPSKTVIKTGQKKGERTRWRKSYSTLSDAEETSVNIVKPMINGLPGLENSLDEFKASFF